MAHPCLPPSSTARRARLRSFLSTFVRMEQLSTCRSTTSNTTCSSKPPGARASRGGEGRGCVPSQQLRGGVRVPALSHPIVRHVGGGVLRWPICVVQEHDDCRPVAPDVGRRHLHRQRPVRTLVVQPSGVPKCRRLTTESAQVVVEPVEQAVLVAIDAGTAPFARRHRRERDGRPRDHASFEL